MLSIGRLTPGRADYYCEQLPGGQDEYYTRNEVEESGTWLGTAAGRLGLDGRVDAEAFRRVLDARHPHTGERLGVPSTTAQRLAGLDLCFSAPKSVSVAWALAPPGTAELIATAHDRAVADAVGFIEDEAVRARRGAGGCRTVATDGVVAAGFGHRTSRAGDPQIHTHVVVANLTPDRDGRWTALDSQNVFRWAKTAGYLYQAALRHHLSAALGVDWGPVRKGAADLTAVPGALTEAFSKRAAQIEAALGGSTEVPLAVAKTATLATRAGKNSLPDLATLRLQWADEVDALGIGALNLSGPGHGSGKDPGTVAADLLSAAGLTANATTFDRRDLLQALAASHPAGRTIADLRADADRLQATPDVVRVAPDPVRGDRYSTVELLAIEDRLVRAAQARSDDRVGTVTPVQLRDVLEARPTLSDEQAQMIASLVTSGAGVEVVVGRGGTGKTYALEAARAAWDAAGYHVIGAALAARAAAELQAGAGIASQTVDRLLADLDRPGPLFGLAPGTIVVIDETGMVGTRKLDRLLAHAERAQAKVVLVGDPRQLPEIEAGGAFAALARTVPTSELVDNRRQTHEWERTALAQLRAARPSDAVDAYHRNGRLTFAATAEQARQKMVADWWQAEKDGHRSAMYALRRTDVEDLNRRARQVLDDAGLLGDERLTIAGREYAVGDRVIATRNDRRLGIRNGTTGTVTAVDPSNRTVTIDTATTGIGIPDARTPGSGKTDSETVLPAGYLEDGHLAYGFATTVHKAQGSTVDRAFLLGSEALYREAGYVGLSRARQRSDLYVVTADTPTRDPDPVAQLIDRLAQSRAQTLATDTLTTALLADPPEWATQLLGEPSTARDDRDRWGRDATRIATYLDRFAERGATVADLTDPGREPPADPDRRRAWEMARMTLTEHRRLDLSRHLDRHLEQGGLEL